MKIPSEELQCTHLFHKTLL